MQPTRRPTPAEWNVIAWALVATIEVAGVIGLIYSRRAATEHPQLADRLHEISIGLLVLGFAVYAIKKIIERRARE